VWVGARATSFFAAHFAKRNTKFGGGGKRGRAKIPSPQPPSFLPARAQIFFKSQRPDFRGKKFGFRSGFGAKLHVASLLPRGFAPRQADCIGFAKIFWVQSPPFAKAKRGSPLSSKDGQTPQRVLQSGTSQSFLFRQRRKAKR